ncbi:DNA polymerase zeta [Lecanicillium sp. MT-2017a]|nr:DNA polymerase zeta [Lecanicillium sp. MT-2017a]
MDSFRVRINCIDHYQATPTRHDPQLRNDIGPSQAAKGPKVPVIRIFGSTETGQKVCAHVHGAFPYLFIEYTGSLASEDVGEFMYRLHLSIDHALSVSYRRDQYGANSRFVARITLAKGVPFYGFHVGYRFFLKIYMFNPMVMTRLADLLQQGAILKQKFQPYEAHLQYLAQFMIDYNLYGCDYLNSTQTTFRAPVPLHHAVSDSDHLWHDRSIPAQYISDDTSLPRVSHCSIEVDIGVHSISNRGMVQERRIHHDFVEWKDALPSDAKLVHSMAGLWKDETARRKRRMSHLKQGSSPFPPEVLVPMSADARESRPQGWIHEEEYRQQISELVATEKEGLGEANPTFDGFVSPNKFEAEVHTILEAVEDLHPSSLLPALGLPSNEEMHKFDPASSIEVDERKARAAYEQEDCLFPEDSDEEMLRLLVEAEKKGDDDAEQGSPGLSLPETKDKCLQIPGICLSAFKTGQPLSVPMSTTLLNVAESAGHVGRASKNLPRRQEVGHLKRSGSGLSSEELSKRTKQDFDFSPSGERDKHDKNSSQRPASHKTASQKQRHPPGSQDAPSSSQTLNFAIVKNQNDPFTRLRLSQKSKFSSSQQSDEITGDKPSTLETEPNFTSPTIHEAGERMTPYSQNALTTPSSNSLTQKFQKAIGEIAQKPCIIFAGLPPPRSDTLSLQPYNLPDVVYQDAYYSDEKDVPLRNREYAGREYRLQSNTLPFLPGFDFAGNCMQMSNPDTSLQAKAATEAAYERQRRQCSLRFWEIARPPPTAREVLEWQEQTARQAAKETTSSKKPLLKTSKFVSQIDGPTPKNKHGFKYTQKRKTTSVEHEVQYMSTMSLEVHVNTRGKLVPNPEEDEVQCIFWSCKGDEVVYTSQNDSDGVVSGIIVSSSGGDIAKNMRRVTKADVIEEESELDSLIRLVEVVKALDPDILTGYEVHGGSWGFLMERARVKYDYNLCDELSRMKSQSHGRFGKESDRWGFNTTSTIRVTGRHMINIWRAMRGELNLLQYTMENVAWHLLHRRVPHFSHKTLTTWYKSGKPHDLSRLLRYFQSRARVDLQILEANELIPRTSEQARLLGVDFFSVFSRGSQFKVESIMFRIAKPENFVLISPSKKQVGGQNALECLPLVMEPQSAFYSSPLLVLDFQSLYPSVMIAYNYCYSTFLGRIANWRGTSKMGITEYNRQEGLLALLKDYINIAPNGMMYTNGKVRKSLLAKMLTEILETRVMVKSGMKEDKHDKTLQQLLNNRQLALKLLANVTYGYTSASFSGRMPCSEIADSIVQTARETLERSIAYIHSVERWGAEVVYGDTDSLFIYLKGRTKDQAFVIGKEISETITKMNPRPVKLKFEKVYHPCVLLAKKRYVGYMYETKDQVKPEFDAKGIETVRRDGTPAEQKIEEKALRLLFETADLSQIKSYFQKQCSKIMRGAVSVQDFCFAREVRLGSYSDKGPPPAGALISARKMLADARAEPQYGERVPYVVITGAPGARLIDRCVAPEDLLSNPHWQLDADYYINKNLIPPLERIFNLVGANVRGWYDEMPKVQRIYQSTTGGKRATLESYMKSSHCLVCGGKFLNEAGQSHQQQAESVAHMSLCPRCRRTKPASVLALQNKLAAEERKYQETLSICRSCTGDAPIDDVRCDSKDCPVFWTRMRQRNKVVGERSATEPVIRGLVQSGALDW